MPFCLRAPTTMIRQGLGHSAPWLRGMNVSPVIEPLLERSISQLSVPGILIDYRLISPGDEQALRDEEERSIASQVVKTRRASGAARIVGRRLLARIGYRDCEIPKGPSGAPLWPTGIVGSFSHDDDVAVAAIGLARDFSAVGIDIEPTETLPAELWELIATPREKMTARSDLHHGRLLFAAKEAVYKAIVVLDGTLLDYKDIDVDLVDRHALLSDGRLIELQYCTAPHLVVLAFVPCPLRTRMENPHSGVSEVSA